MKIRNVLCFLMAITVTTLFVSTFAVAAVEVEQVTDDPSWSDQPDGVFDSAGNAHVVWSDSRDGAYEIYYKMVDSDGNPLIDDTIITEDDGLDSVRPRVAIDSADQVFVVWHARAGSLGQLPYLARLDPSLDVQDGTPATADSIMTLGPDMVSSAATSDQRQNTPFVVVDDNDDLHIVWEGYDEEVIKYRKLDSDGIELVAEKVISSGSGAWFRTIPDLSLDPDGNAHIVWSEWGTDGEIYYTMVDGMSGSTMIDATRLTDDDGIRSWYPTVSVDGDGMGYIVWMDGISPDDSPADPLDHPEIHFMKIDPSLAAQDGSAAVADSIKVIPDLYLTTRDGIPNIRPYSQLLDSRIMVTFYQWDDVDVFSDANLYLQWVNKSGSVVKQELLSTTSTSGGNRWNHARMAKSGSNRAAVIWSDTQFGGNNNLAAAEVKIVPSGGGGGCATITPTDGSSWMDGLVLLIIGLLLIMIQRRYVSRSAR